MSRTFKDRKEEKAKHINREPQFKRQYRMAKANGFKEDSDTEVCPDCGASMTFEAGFLSCQECNWGAFADELDELVEMEFFDVA